MAKLRRTIVKPGYHLKPKYDLHNFRMIRNRTEKALEVPELPLVSLIDMFTILVIYLLMNFSATGEVFFIQKNLRMPEAKHSRPLESAPLITITQAGVSLDVEKGLDIPDVENENSATYPVLVSALRKLKAIQSSAKPTEAFKGSINIQADESIELTFIKRVMQVCIQEGWTGINFAVRDSAK